MIKINDDQCMTLKDISENTGLNYQKVFREICTMGKIESFKIGQTVFVKVEEVKKLYDLK